MTAYPNAELMEMYGTDTYFLEKTGQLPLAARLLTGSASMGLMHADLEHQAEVVRDAEMMNARFRALENARMARSIAALNGGRRSVFAQDMPMADLSTGEEDLADLPKMSSADPDALFQAWVVGQYLAQADMDKVAFIGGGAAFMKTLSGFGTKALDFAKSFSGTAKVRQAAQTAGVDIPKVTGATAPGGPGIFTKVKQWVSPTERMKAVAEGADLPNITGAAKATAPAAAPAAVQAAAPASKPLISGWTKAKIGLGLAGAGTLAAGGYAATKGAQGFRDYMMVPSHGGHAWGHYGPQPAMNVGAGGYVPQM